MWCDFKEGSDSSELGVRKPSQRKKTPQASLKECFEFESQRGQV